MSDRLREMAREHIRKYGDPRTTDETDVKYLAALLAECEAEERERCAKVVEAFPTQAATATEPFRHGVEEQLASVMNECRSIFAAAIRALSPGGGRDE